MPTRVSSAPAAPLPRSAPARTRASTTTEAPARAWAAGTRQANRESPLDRWARLHATPVEVPARRTAVVSERAKELAKSVSSSGSRMSPRLAQDMLDGLTAAGLADPLWPNLKSMGFGEDEAAAIHDQLKSFENDRRTSLSARGGGVARLAAEGKKTVALATVVEALAAGKQPDLSKLSPALATAIGNAKRLGEGAQLEAARTLLENQLGAFITDSPIDLVDGAPDAAKAGILAAISAQTAQVKGADDAGDLRLMKHHGFTAFGLLKELAVLDPAAAQKAGLAFAKALHDREEQLGVKVLD